MTSDTSQASAATDFEAFYQGQSPVDGMTFAALPWDIGEPQPVVIGSERAGRFVGSVLDVGCGLGDNAIYLASRGYRVTGTDIAPTAVEWARKRAAAHGGQVEFAVADVLSMQGYEGRFDSILDSTLFDCLDTDDRARYARSLFRVARPGAKLTICYLSDTMPTDLPGVFRISEQSARATLGDAGWTLTDVRRDTFLVNEYAGQFFANEGVPVDTDDRGRPRLPAWVIEAERPSAF